MSQTRKSTAHIHTQTHTIDDDSFSFETNEIPFARFVLPLDQKQCFFYDGRKRKNKNNVAY